MITPHDIQALSELLGRMSYTFDTGQSVYYTGLIQRLFEAHAPPPAAPPAEQPPGGSSAVDLAAAAEPLDPAAPAPSLDPMHEQLAALAHAQWAAWMEYFLARARTDADGRVSISGEYAAALHRQIDTPYADLTEHEKALDRSEATRVERVVGQVLSAESQTGESQ